MFIFIRMNAAYITTCVTYITVSFPAFAVYNQA